MSDDKYKIFIICMIIIVCLIYVTPLLEKALKYNKFNEAIDKCNAEWCIESVAKSYGMEKWNED